MENYDDPYYMRTQYCCSEDLYPQKQAIFPVAIIETDFKFIIKCFIIFM